MPFPGQVWSLNFKVVACIFHVLAIVSGIFRSTYRWYTSRFGWDDTWASLAVLTDIGCLICTWAQRSLSSHPTNTDINLNWVAVITMNSVPWEARLSMMSTITRIATPLAFTRRMSSAIAIAFGLMWIAVLVQKMYRCGVTLCHMTHEIALCQLITDVISDILLVLMPILLMKDVKVPRSQRMLLVSSFTSSIAITLISIPQSAYLFLPVSSSSLLFTHLKAALSVVICNLLVVVTFAYRVYHKMDIDVDSEGSKESENAQFTSVVSG